MSLTDNSLSTAFEAAVDDALRTAPLAPPPPMLYASIMRKVRTRPRKPLVVPFRIGWLDLALSLFGAGMLAAAWLAWQLIPAPLATYLRLQALYILQRLWYLDSAPLLWVGLGILALFATLAVAALSCATLGICSRRAN